MANEAILTQTPSSENRSMWSSLSRWLAPAAESADADVGYESAHPWTLGEDTAHDVSGETLYF